ncbi:hypothetical protein AURDEDRAFT_58781 [Auricularia subglabra TFB-10046 SS5]|nr:hypothetical protein AURDEDRAFT_58781 [Auricularia subglabra TFB-10046 SS5]
MSRVYAVAFSPDSSYVVSGSEDGALCMWNVSLSAGIQTGFSQSHSLQTTGELSRARSIKLCNCGNGPRRSDSASSRRTAARTHSLGSVRRVLRPSERRPLSTSQMAQTRKTMVHFYLVRKTRQDESPSLWAWPEERLTV